VGGYAYITGYHYFVVESEDGIGIDGFSVKDVSK
jgi:trans-L-3-hydroxyproline dehydratase